jgi:hypothetical protein
MTSLYTPVAARLPTRNGFRHPGEGPANWEREEAARHLIESGYPPESLRSGIKHVGDGERSLMLACIFGPCRASFEAASAEEHPLIDYAPYAYPPSRRRNLTWGGRRLTVDQFVDLYSAVAFANLQGYILNAHVAITWGLLGITDHSKAAEALLRSVMNPLKEWYRARSNGRPLVWLYVHEDGNTHGFHTHLLLDMPTALIPGFKAWLRKRLRDICTSGPLPRNAYKLVAPPSDPIGRQWRYFQYLMKGIDADAVLQSNVGSVSHVPVAQLIRVPIDNPGDVDCTKKCAVANVIGGSARRAAGFSSWLDRRVVDIRRMYAGMEYLEYVRNGGDVPDSKLMGQLLAAEKRLRDMDELESLQATENAQLRKEGRKARRLFLKEQAEIQVLIEKSKAEDEARRLRLLTIKI